MFIINFVAAKINFICRQIKFLPHFSHKRVLRHKIFGQEVFVLDLKELKTKSDKVYPEIIITAPNPAEAALLQSDYAGTGSETTAIMTYIYQSYIIRLFDEDIADVLEKIAITEMHHHDILGTTIARLGGNPVIGADNRWWTGANVNYSVNLKDMLTENIKAEQAAIQNYRCTIAKLTNESIKETLECIIADEEVHIATFAILLKYLEFWK